MFSVLRVVFFLEVLRYQVFLGSSGKMTWPMLLFKLGVLFQSIISYGVFPLFVESVRAFLSSSDMYALHMVKWGSTTPISVSCIEEATIRNIVLGTVVVARSWDEDVCELLANWHSCFNTINGPRVLVVDKVEPFSEVLPEKVVGGLPLVVLRRDLYWQDNLVRAVS